MYNYWKKYLIEYFLCYWPVCRCRRI